MRAMHRAGLRVLRIGQGSWLIRPAALLWMTILLLLALGSALYSLSQGTLSLPFSAVMRGLFPVQQSDSDWQYIIHDIRLPRLLMALLCGAMLGAAGAAMQSLTRNGLADPGLIGVKEGCSVCVLLLIFQFPAAALYWRPIFGLLGGGLTALLVVFLAREVSRPRFVLIGIGVSWMFAAALGIFMTTADIRDVQTALLWLAGSLHAANWPLFLIAGSFALPTFVWLLMTARSADIAALGSETAKGLGLRMSRQAFQQLLAPVILTAASVACVGSIGFVGLMAPHMTRFLLRGGQVTLIVGSALIGALFVVISDSIGRLAFLPLQLPAGIIIAMIGGPFFLLLLWRRRDHL